MKITLIALALIVAFCLGSVTASLIIYYKVSAVYHSNDGVSS